MLDGCCSSLSIILAAILDFFGLISMSLSTSFFTGFVGVLFLGVVSTAAVDILSVSVGLSGATHMVIDVETHTAIDVEDEDVGLIEEDVTLSGDFDLYFDSVDRDDLRGLLTSMVVPKQFVRHFKKHS